jgi:hypothetical protein
MSCSSFSFMDPLRAVAEYLPYACIYTYTFWTRIPFEAQMSVFVYSVYVMSCVQVVALRRADPPPKESCRLCIGLRKRKVVKTQQRAIKIIPVRGRGGLYGCQMLRITYCLENRLIDGGNVVSPTHWPRSTPQKYYSSVSGIHFW